MSQKIPIRAPECSPFPCHFQKEVYYMKLRRRNDTKIMKIKFIHMIKNRLRMRTRMASRIPTANISRKLDTRNLLLFCVRSTIGHRKLAGKLLFLKALSRNWEKTTISFFTSVRPSAWNNSAPTGRIFLKYDVWVFLENLSRKYKFH